MPASTAAPAQAPGPAEGLCLDFANTRYWRGSPTPTETLNRPADLLGWCEAAGLVDAATIAAVRAAWAAQPGLGEAALASAIALREAIFALFAAQAAGGAAPTGALGAIKAALAAAPGRARLRPAPEATPGGFVWEIPRDQALLAPVIWSAGDLLAGARRAKLRQCANPRCLWLFLDDSKAGTRRWCSMASCGNRAKAHRHYAKTRAQAEGAP
jgi:predicted RNA-binding Zn ribbon-like protein